MQTHARTHFRKFYSGFGDANHSNTGDGGSEHQSSEERVGGSWEEEAAAEEEKEEEEDDDNRNNNNRKEGERKNCFYAFRPIVTLL